MTNKGQPHYIHADPDYRISREDLESVITSNTKKVWVNALIILLYYYGLRITEALSLEKRNFRIFEDKKTKIKFLQVRSATLKNRTDKHRTLYVPMDQPYVSFLYDYVRSVKGPRAFSYSRQWARVQIQKVMPQVSPHVFRHNVLNDMAQEGLNEFSLESWAGWSDARPAKNYVQKVKNLETAKRFYNS